MKASYVAADKRAATPNSSARSGIMVSHPTGNMFNRALLGALELTGRLAKFHTTLWADESGRVSHPLLRLTGRSAQRRRFPLPASRMEGRGTRELVRLLAGAAGMPWLTKHEAGWASVDAVYRDMDANAARWVFRNRPSAVYAYEDGARDTFRAAAKLGIPAIYDLPIAHWRCKHAILNEEAARRPEWEPTLIATRDSPQKLERKDEELSLASGIVVPSQFVADSLEAIDVKAPVHVAAFGSPVVPEHSRRHGPGGSTLRVLFAGSMTQRKGLADVFDAMKLLKRRDVELVVMGTPLMPMSFYRAQYGAFVHEGTRPHQEVLKVMAGCDALVLPSLVEGRALVQQEALACGLPLIVTRNAGADDLVDEGRTGFLVPVRAPDEIAAKISWLADNRTCLSSMRELCVAKGAACTWEAYADGILAFVGRIVSRFE